MGWRLSWAVRSSKWRIDNSEAAEARAFFVGLIWRLLMLSSEDAYVIRDCWFSSFVGHGVNSLSSVLNVHWESLVHVCEAGGISSLYLLHCVVSSGCLGVWILLLMKCIGWASKVRWVGDVPRVVSFLLLWLLEILWKGGDIAWLPLVLPCSFFGGSRKVLFSLKKTWLFPFFGEYLG